MKSANRRRPKKPRDKASLLRSELAASQHEPLTIPSRWLKVVIGLFLLPVAWVLTEAFFSCFSQATLHHQFWATEEFWFFSLGVILWLIAFVGLPKPLMVYVFGHELTHAVWVWLMGGRVSQFRVGREGGHILTNKSNFLIALAPYFFPIYSLLVIVAWGAFSFFYEIQPWREYLFALIGITWGFHFTFTVWMIPKGQSDLDEHGHFFSLVVIYLMNLLLLGVFLVVAAPQVGLRTFAREIMQSAIDFSVATMSLIRQTF